MFAKIGILTVLALCLLAGKSEAQECVAESVVNMKVEASHLLTWSLRPGEPCPVSEYIIYIFHPDQPAEHRLIVNETSVDVSFLEVCEEWVFVVVPVSGITLGAQRRLSAKLPLPADADLSLTDLNMTYGLGRTFISWNLSDSRLGNCSLKYRVTVEEEGSPVIENSYVNDQYFSVYFLPTCRNYQFGVRAINTASPVIEGPLLTEVLPLPGRKQYQPGVYNPEIGSTWANFSVRVESEVRNPCPLVELHIFGEGVSSQTIPLTNEQPRPDIPVAITDLNPNTEYNIFVSVSNSAGLSDTTLYQFITTSSDVELDKEPATESEGSP